MYEVPGYDHLTDEELFKRLNALQEITGEIYVIVDICHRDGFGPFILEADQLGELIENYYRIFSEHFYDADVIIISFSEKVVWFTNCSDFVGLVKM